MINDTTVVTITPAPIGIIVLFATSNGETFAIPATAIMTAEIGETDLASVAVNCIGTNISTGLLP